MVLEGSLHAALCCAVVAVTYGLPSGLLPYYPMMMADTSAASSLRQGRDVPIYHDDAPIMPRHQEHVDLKAYESAVVDLLAEVDKKDRAPHPRGSESPMALAQLTGPPHAPSRQVDVNVNVDPYANVNVMTGSRKPVVEDPPQVFMDNHGGEVGVGVNVVKHYKPLNLGINIPGIFNLQIFRTQDGQRRIGIGVLPGLSNIQIGHDTPHKFVGVGVDVGTPTAVYREAHKGYY